MSIETTILLLLTPLLSMSLFVFSDLETMFLCRESEIGFESRFRFVTTSSLNPG